MKKDKMATPGGPGTQGDTDLMRKNTDSPHPPGPGTQSSRMSNPSLSSPPDNENPTEEKKKTAQRTVGRNNGEQKRPAMQMSNDKTPKILLLQKKLD